MNADERRKLWIAHWRSCQRRATEAAERGEIIWRPKLLPNELRGLTCGARTRAGTQCRLTGLYSNGRCKLHGGKSTGPVTAVGRARSLQNLRRGSKP